MSMFEKKIKDLIKGSKIPQNMINRGQIVLDNWLKPIKNLLEQKRVPEEPWEDEQIKFLLKLLSQMDTDKDLDAARVGEREARISTPLLNLYSAGFCHGIGRSGEISAPQPKAPGGSIMYELTNKLAKYAMTKFGLPNIKDTLVIPMATGMSLSLCLAGLRPEWKNDTLYKRKVVVPRLDHTSIIKGIKYMGAEPKIVEGEIYGDAVRVPIEKISAGIDKDTFSILSFTSFFPPREADNIKEIAKLAQEKDITHIVVNAYGVQSEEWMKMIRSAIDAGRVDAIIQSTDKNFLTPVGGSIICTPHKDTMEKISRTYAGRANASPIFQFLISILSLGIKGYQALIEEQKKNRKYLAVELKKIADKIGEKILNVFNPVAVALTLDNLKGKNLSSLGGALYTLRVTGPRIYDPTEKSFGMCCNHYPHAYIVINSAIGATKKDIDLTIARFQKSYDQFSKSLNQ